MIQFKTEKGNKGGRKCNNCGEEKLKNFFQHL